MVVEKRLIEKMKRHCGEGIGGGGRGSCTASEGRGSFFVNLRICLVSQITSTSLPPWQLIQLIKRSR